MNKIKQLKYQNSVKPELVGNHKNIKTENRNYQKIANLITGGKVLDVGCSTGDFSTFLSKKIDYDGVDNDKERIDYANKNYKGTFIYSRGENLPFKDKTFDYVILTEVLEHVPNPLELLKECNRVLKSGGKIVGSTPNATDFNRIIKSLVRKSHGSLEHLFVFGSFEMKTILEVVGFKNIKILFTLFCLNIYKLKIRWGSSFLSWLFPNLGEGIIFVGDK
jgi:ubiquinone/menaquinone biosynthesis C-methylase UbiE